MEKMRKTGEEREQVKTERMKACGCGQDKGEGKEGGCRYGRVDEGKKPVKRIFLNERKIL